MSEEEKTIITGRAVKLDDQRTVGAYRISNGNLAVRFTNGERITEFAITQEAANALLLLLTCELDGPVA